VSIATSTVEAPAPPASGVQPAPSTAWVTLIAGAIGLLASVTLTVEKIRLLTDAAYVPSCNLNPVLSCGPVMATPQASVLGFPNPLMGIVPFTVLVVWAATMLLLVAFAALASQPGRIHKSLQLLQQWRWTLIALWFIGLFLLVFIRFQDYWLTLV